MYRRLIVIAVQLGLCLCATLALRHPAGAVGTAFTYQGQLGQNGTAANGSCDFQFSLFDAATNGGQIGNTQTISNVSVTNGLFTASLDFGGSSFTGAPRFLQVGVRCPAGGGTFTALSPRNAITASPYALFANALEAGAVTSATIADGSIQGADLANAAITGANVAGGAITTEKIADGTVGAADLANGAVNPFKIAPGPPGTVLTTAAGSVTWSTPPVTGWGVAGNAGTTAVNYLGTADDKPLQLRVNNQRALLLQPGSGAPNIIAGAAMNRVADGVSGAVIGGGGSGVDQPNEVLEDWGTVAGGYGNRVAVELGTIGGGGGNVTADFAATVGGGLVNEARGRYATVGGGGENQALGYAATIGGGSENIAAADQDFATIGGGSNNFTSNEGATIAGGAHNEAAGMESTVGGGRSNEASGNWATIGGGRFNSASAAYSTISGGGPSNQNDSATSNVAYDNYGTIGGGGFNRTGVSDGNPALQTFATVGGGGENRAEGQYSTIGGGYLNRATKITATVAGGYGNEATGGDATVGGGSFNFARAQYAVVPGGRENDALGLASFAAGRRAKAYNPGCFVWGDSTDADVVCNTNNSFVARASGGVKFFSNAAQTTGVVLSPGGGSWSVLSDRNVKDHVEAVDGRAVLEQVAALRIHTWNYQSQDPAIRHIGPMAQDFYARFRVGEDERHIATIDADGVALAAIQGLYEMVRERDAALAALATTNRALEARLAALEESVRDIGMTAVADDTTRKLPSSH